MMPPTFSDTTPPQRRQSVLSRLTPHLPLVAALALRLASEPTASLSYPLVAAYALFGRGHAIRALALSWLFTMLSPGIAPDAPAATIGRYAVLFAAALSAFVHSHTPNGPRRFDPFAGATLLLGVFIIVHALLFSPLADVSTLKAVSWTMAMTTSIAAWSGLSPRQREQVAEQLFWGLVAVLLVSLPLAATSLGYLTNGTGLQGVLNQPQAFGPTMALLCVWAVTRLLGEARPSWWLLTVAGASLLAVIMSEARTAGLAAALAVAVAVLAGPGLAGRSVLAMAPGLRSARVWGVLIAALVVVLIMATTFSDLFQHYITKSGRASVDGLWDAFDLSRGRQMQAMMDNIRQQPWTGIGFGIDSVPELMNVSREPIFGLPVGASIEKGVTPLMVVEELGIFGAVLVGFWVLRLLRTSARGGIAPFAVVLTVLLMNLGEATLFSPGGVGLLPLILLGWAYASGRPAPERRHA